MSASSPPAVKTQHVEGKLDGGIYWQAWLPEAEATAIVVIAHGVSEHGARYRYVVETLVPRGVAVYAIDHRGHGHSPGKRAQLDRVSLVLADLDTLIDLARTEHPGRKCFLLGHSMGGCLAIAYTLEHQDKLDGLALSAPLAGMEAASPVQRFAARVLSTIAPDLGVYQVEAAAVSRDPDEVHAYETDPLVSRNKLPARTVHELTETVATFETRVPELRLPLLVMIGTADELVPIEGAQMVFDRASSEDKTMRTYDGFFHEIFNEPAGERDQPLSDLAGWLSERAA